MVGQITAEAKDKDNNNNTKTTTTTTTTANFQNWAAVYSLDQVTVAA